MKNIFRVLLPLIIIIICVFIAITIVSMKQAPEKKEEKISAPLVETLTAQLTTSPLIIQSNGVFKPKHQTNLIAEVSGRIISLSDTFAAGGVLKQGSVLAQIDPGDYEAALIDAQANLQRAQAALQEEVARGKVAKKEWQGTTSLLPPELGLRKPQLAREKAALRSAQAALARAQRNLTRTKIVAPYDVLVNKRHVDLGQFVGTGTALGVVSSINIGEIRLPISNADYNLLGEQILGATVTLTRRENGENKSWRGKIVRDEGVIDEASRMVYIVAQVATPYQLNNKLKFGTFINASISSVQTNQLVILPSYLYKDGKVATVDEDNILHINDVTLFRRDKNHVYLSSGIIAGQQVALTKVEHLYDGMKVRLSSDQPTTSEDPGHGELAITETK